MFVLYLRHVPKHTVQGQWCDVVQGHALYYGRGELADEYFDKLGYTLPYRVNVADFILDLSSADVYTEARYCHPPLPYLTLPYLTLPYLTLPYLTLPYLTLP